MKTKKVKLLVALGMVLLIMCVFNTKVNAWTEKNEINTDKDITNEIFDEVVPDTIELDLQNKQCEDYQILNSQIMDKIIENLQLKGISVSESNNNITHFNFEWSRVPQAIEETDSLGVSYYNDKNSHYSKRVAIKWINKLKKNENDKQKFEQVLNQLGFIKSDRLVNGETVYECNYNKYVELGTPFDNYFGKEDASSPIHLLKNNSAISFPQLVDDGGAGWFDENFNLSGSIYYNNVYYGIIEYTETYNFIITVPNNIEDTEEAYINYAFPKIEKRIKEYAGGGNVNITGTLKVNKKNGNTYTVSDDKQNFGDIIIKKGENSQGNTANKAENVNLLADGIKIDSTTNVISKNTVLKVQEIKKGSIYDMVAKALNKVANKFVLYDITLECDNVKIQPNGKVKVSIPIPSNYNKDKLEVYRIEESGEKIKYVVTVEGNYATFETNHFSTYVLAEINQNNKEKDDTPKTGTVNYFNLLLPFALVTIAGIVIYNKKQNK